MISGIYNLIDGSLTQQETFETIANNISNSSTNGFKKDIISFNQALEMQSSSKTDFSQGALKYTGNELDVALGSKGFFKVQTSAGIRYTRDGAFSMDSEGHLTTWNGDIVLGQNGPITIEGTHVSIKSDGQVVVDNESVDTLSVVDFENPALLKKEGGSYYVYPKNVGGIFTSNNIKLQQGYLENSNVDATQEMIKMIETFRAFESVERAIQSMDRITGKMVNDYGMVP